MTFLRDIINAPFERQTVMIIGNISGVRPTATDKAKSSASAQLCLVKPTIRKVAVTITIMNRIMSQVKACTPLSKLVASRFDIIFAASDPK